MNRVCKDVLWRKNGDGSVLDTFAQPSKRPFEIAFPSRISAFPLFWHIKVQYRIGASNDGGQRGPKDIQSTSDAGSSNVGDRVWRQCAVRIECGERMSHVVDFDVFEQSAIVEQCCVIDAVEAPIVRSKAKEGSSWSSKSATCRIMPANARGKMLEFVQPPPVTPQDSCGVRWRKAEVSISSRGIRRISST